MREDNLLVLRKRRYVVTTNSRHTYAVYQNLARKFTPTMANQLWVADITYIRLREQFVYLAVILDACSRRAVGWELGATLEATPDREGTGAGAGREGSAAGHHSPL